MKYKKPQMQTFSMEQIAQEINASACGSATGSCYGASYCGCTYS